MLNGTKAFSGFSVDDIGKAKLFYDISKRLLSFFRHEELRAWAGSPVVFPPLAEARRSSGLSLAGCSPAWRASVWPDVVKLVDPVLVPTTSTGAASSAFALRCS
jgi:hypothetical protein